MMTHQRPRSSAMADYLRSHPPLRRYQPGGGTCPHTPVTWGLGGHRRHFAIRSRARKRYCVVEILSLALFWRITGGESKTACLNDQVAPIW